MDIAIGTRGLLERALMLPQATRAVVSRVRTRRTFNMLKHGYGTLVAMPLIAAVITGCGGQVDALEQLF